MSGDRGSEHRIRLTSPLMSADIDPMAVSRRNLDSFGKRLKLAREAKGLNSNALSRLISAEDSYVSQIETGKKSHKAMDPVRLLAMAKALDVRLEWLVNGEDPMSPPVAEPPVHIHPNLEKLLRDPSMRRRWRPQTIAAVRADPCDDLTVGQWIDKMDSLDVHVRKLLSDRK